MYISYILQHYFLIVFYLQRFFQFLLSSLPAFFVFQGLFSFLYLYIVVLHPFITTLLWQCPSVHGCVFSSFFFALLMWKSLFSADNSFFAAQLYIGISPIILFKILRCLCVVTSWFATITFPVSAYIASLCARTSMLVDPQHQYIVFLNQFLKGGFYTGKFEHLLPQRSPAAAKGGFYTREREILVSLLPCFYAYYPNSSAGVFRCLCKERFLHRKNQL